MKQEQISFDQVFKIWLDSEVDQIEGRDILTVAQQKGFTSIVKWRLATALRLGLDKKSWVLEEVVNPEQILPNIIVGPYQGWSIFFENKLDKTFAEALEIPEFLQWCNAHNRIMPILQNFPISSTIICLRKPDGRLIHIEGGHRMCAVALANKIGNPIDFTSGKLFMAVSDATEADLELMQRFLREGTFKQ